MLSGSALLVFKSKTVKSIIGLAVKYGYSELQKKSAFYKVLHELGLSRPKDEFRSLFLHATFLFASKGKHPEFIELILLEDSQAAFKEEIYRNKSTAFINELDDQLHTNQLVKEIKYWNEIPFNEIEEFIEIYRDLARSIATPVHNEIIQQNNQISDDLKAGFQQQNAQLLEMTQKLNILAETTGTEPLETEYNRQLTAIIKQIEAGNFKRSADELTILKDQIIEKVKPPLKFKILTNLGFCQYKVNQIDVAASTLIEAYQYNPETKIALSNIVNAYLMIDDIVNAEKYLGIFKQSFPDATEPYSALIKLNANKLSIESLLELVPHDMREKPEIITSLGLAAKNKGLLTDSINFLETSRKLKPEDDYPTLHLIQSYLEKHSTNFKALNLRIISNETKKELEYALELVNSQLVRILKTDADNLKAQLFLAKAHLLDLLKRRDEAITSSDSGLLIEPENPYLLKQKGTILALSGKLEEAIQVLSHINDYSKVPDVPSLLAEIYGNLSQHNKGIQLLENFISNAEPEDKFTFQAKQILLELYIHENQTNKVKEWVELHEDSKRVIDKLCIAKGLRFLGQIEESKEVLLTIASLINGDTGFREKFLLSEELLNEELYTEALHIMEDIADRDFPSETTTRLVKLYRKLGHTSEALQLLENLRVKNGPISHLTPIEISIYHDAKEYAIARNILIDFLNIFPDNLGMQLHLSGLNIRLEHLEQAEEFLNKPIEYWKLDNHSFKVYLAQLASVNKKRKLLEVAYEFKRLKDDMEAHSTYLQALLQFPSTEEENFDTPTVTMDCAVTLINSLGERFVLIVEDRPSSELRENEVNTNHPRFRHLFGKKIDDTIIFDGSYSKWKIEQIDNKFRFAFKESQAKCSTIYAETSPIKSFHVDDFWDVIQNLRDEDYTSSFTHALNLYRNRKVPLGTISEGFKKSPIELWHQVRSEIGLQTCFGNSIEMQNALEALMRKPRLCVDILSLITIYELGIIKYIEPIFGSILITESTFDIILDLEEESRYFVKTDANEKVQGLVSFTKDHTIRMQPKEILTINRKEREEKVRLLGGSFYETSLLAKEIGGILYSEDLMLRNVILQELDLKGIWSQAILTFLFNQNEIGEEIFEDANLLLVTLNYKHTAISKKTFFRTLEKSSFKIDEDLNQCLKILNGNNSNLDSACGVALDFLFDLWQLTNISSSAKDDISFSIIVGLLNNRHGQEVFEVLMRLLRAEIARSTDNSIIYIIIRHIKKIQNDFYK